MPFEIVHDRENRGVIIYAYGSITDSDLLERIALVLQEASFSQLSYILSDRSHCDSYRITASTVQQMASLYRARAHLNPGLIWAFVSPTPALFGLSRMFGLLLDELLTATVVETRREADCWIQEKLGILPQG
jgi:hypothetical protein